MQAGHADRSYRTQKYEEKRRNNTEPASQLVYRTVHSTQCKQLEEFVNTTKGLGQGLHVLSVMTTVLAFNSRETSG
jgi:hypothetical protein